MTSAAAPTLAARHPHPLWLYTLIGLMQFFWSANFLVGKIALREFPALLVAGLRVWIAALVILPVYAWKARGDVAWKRSDLPKLLFLGFIGGGINQVGFVWGLSKTSVAHSAFIIGMTPISVLAFAAARGLERISARRVAGMATAVAGVLLLSTERTGAGPTLAGDLVTLLGGTAFALYSVLSKEVTRQYGTLALNTFLFGSGALLLSPLVIWQGSSFLFGGVSFAGWLALVYMAVFPSLVCYLIFFYALGWIAPSRLATLAYLQPLAATASGALLLGEPVSGTLLAGGAVILAGVWLTERA